MMRRTALGILMALVVVASVGCSADDADSGDASDAAAANADNDAGSNDGAEVDTGAETPTVSIDEPVPSGTFAEWSAKMTAACTASAEAAALVTEPSGSSEALIEFAIISNEESVAVQAAGLPEDRTDDARRWLAIHQAGSNLFLQIAAEGTIDPLDERSTDLQGLSAQLSATSQELGIEGCVGQQVG